MFGVPHWKLFSPCVGKQDDQHYEQGVEQIRQILKGNIRSVVQHFKSEMFKLSEKMEYEKAQILKEKIEQLEHYQSKSSIVSPTINDVDVFSIVSDQDYAYVNFFKVSVCYYTSLRYGDKKEIRRNKRRASLYGYYRNSPTF